MDSFSYTNKSVFTSEKTIKQFFNQFCQILVHLSKCNYNFSFCSFGTRSVKKLVNKVVNAYVILAKTCIIDAILVHRIDITDVATCKKKLRQNDPHQNFFTDQSNLTLEYVPFNSAADLLCRRPSTRIQVAGMWRRYQLIRTRRFCFPTVTERKRIVNDLAGRCHEIIIGIVGVSSEKTLKAQPHVSINN